MLNTNIEWDREAKYLSMVLSKRLSMKSHIEHVINKTQNAIKLLYPLINRRSRLSIHNKTQLFKLGLRPIYTYAAPVLKQAPKSLMKMLQVQQNKVLKMIHNLHWRTPTTHVHEIAEIEPVADFIERLTNQFNSTNNSSHL